MTRLLRTNNLLFLFFMLLGLFNAPLFRNYTYRQVALIGSFLTFFGIFLSAFANTFLQYIAVYSCIYGKSIIGLVKMNIINI